MQGSKGGENHDHAHDGMAVVQESLGFFGVSVF
jgi:hypothetical protein